MKKLNTRTLGFAPLLLSVAVAATAQEQQSFALEEVIVTAQKREESLQDTPISITAFSQDDLAQQGITAIDDLQGKVPSLNLTPFPTQNTSLRLFIRGVGPGDIQVSQDPAVGVYIDQVYIGRATGLALELADLAQVEVLKGVQGTLFGRNSIGGAINMTTIKPRTGEFTFDQELGFGNYDLFRSKTSLNVPITDSLALRAVFLYKEKDGFVDNDGPGRDFMDGKDEGGKLDFLWEINDEWSVRYAFDYSRSEFVSPTFQAVESAALSELLEIPISSDRLDTLSTKDEMRPSDSSVDGHALTITREWDNYTFKSITAYREFEYFEFANLESGSPSERLWLNGNAGIELLGHRGHLDQDQLSQEFQFHGSNGSTFDYVLGLYYFDEDATKDGGQGSRVIVQQPNEINHIDVSNDAWAVFGQSNWTPEVWDSRLTITTGIRYTEDDRDAARVFLKDPDPNGVSFIADPGNDFSNVSYTLVGSWAFTDDINGYAKVVTGYKAGGYNIRASNEASYVRGFDEEVITTFELGLKSELWDRRVRLNAALYYSEWEDMQLNLSDLSTPADVRDTNVINAGESEINGLELDLTALLTQGLTFTLSYAYLDTEFTEVNAPDDTGVTEDDFVFTNSPEHQYTLGLNYYYSLNFGGLTASVNYYWVDERYDTQKAFEAENGQAVIDDYGLLGAFVGLSEISLGNAGSLDINLWGRNLTDEEYETSAPSILQTANGYHKAVTWGEPRTYGIDFIYRYAD